MTCLALMTSLMPRIRSRKGLCTMFGMGNDGPCAVGTCPYCGMALSGAPEGNQDPSIVGTCSVCGDPLYEGDRFCTSCGASIDAPVSVQPTVTTWSTEYAVPDAPSPDVPAYMSVGASALAPELPNGIAEDDTVTARPMMVRISRDEARMGCRKTIEVDGQFVTVDIPAGVGIYTKVDVPNLGYFDEMTGARGPLRLSFRIV